MAKGSRYQQRDLRGLLDPKFHTEDVLEVEVKAPKKKPASRTEEAKTPETLTKIAYLFTMGHSDKSIAAELGFSADMIRSARKTKEFRAILNTFTSEISRVARLFMSSATLKATKTVLELLDSEDERVRLTAAKDILDRSGVKQNEVLEVVDKREAHLHEMSKEELSDLINMGIKELGPMLQKHNQNVKLVSASEDEEDMPHEYTQ